MAVSRDDAAVPVPATLCGEPMRYAELANDDLTCRLPLGHAGQHNALVVHPNWPCPNERPAGATADAPSAEPTCPNAPSAAAHLNARLDRAEELVRAMAQMGDEVRALVHGITEDVVVLAQAMAKGEVAASELLPFIARWDKIRALAETAQAKWAQK